MARRPIWIGPNLLSLDAPLVAVAWFWVFKQLWLVKYHQPTLPWFLALVVWCIYVADRLIDERMAQMGAQRDTSRHQFHRQWRKPLTVGLLIGTLGSIGLLLVQARGLITHGIFVMVPVVALLLAAGLEGLQLETHTLIGMTLAVTGNVFILSRKKRAW